MKTTSRFAINKRAVVHVTTGGHKYVWIFTQPHLRSTLQDVGMKAASDDFDLTFYEAARITKRIREVCSD